MRIGLVAHAAISVLLVGCASKISVEVTNAPPSAAILAPFAGDVRQPGEAYTLRGSASDPTEAPSELVARWFVDGQEPCPSAAPGEAGETQCAITVPNADAIVVLEVTDRQGSTAQATATLEVAENTAPTAQITAPADGATVRSDVDVLLEGAVADAEAAPGSLRVSWSSSLEGLLDEPVADAGGGVASLVRLRPGQHVITLTAIDARADAGTDRITLDVAAPNVSPTCAVTSPASGAVLRFGEPVAWIGVAADGDHPANALSVAWASDRDGALGGTPPTAGGAVVLEDVALSAGLHTVSMTVTDPEGAACVASQTVVVQAPPTDPVVTISPAVARTDDTLRASLTAASTDPNGDAVAYVWAWRRNGALTSETTPDIAPAATTKGETWTVEVYATDGSAISGIATASVMVENTPPTVRDVAITPGGSVLSGQTLACSATVEDPDEIVTVTYAWTLDGVPTATGATYVVAGGRDATITCTVTAVDGDGATGSGSASVGIENTAPSLDRVQIAPDPPVAGDTLVCTGIGAVDAEGDPVSLAYAWTRNGQPVGVGDTYTGALVGGDVMGCSVTPSDGRLDGATLSASVAVANTAPVLAGPDVSPSPARVGDVVSCIAGAVDVDGTAPDVSRRWTLDGVEVGTDATWTVPRGTPVGAVLACDVTADDGEGGAVTGSDATVIADSPPDGLRVTLAPDPPSTEDVLTATVAGEDPNGEALTWSFVWTVDGDEVPGVNGATLEGSAWFDAGETVTVVATASTASGTSSTSDAVVVENTAPSGLSIALVFIGGDWRNGLSCSVSQAATDADGDTLSYGFAWEVDGAPALGVATSGTEERIAGSSLASRQLWTCTVRALDGATEGPPASASIEVPYCQTYEPDCSVSATVWAGNGHAYGLLGPGTGWTWDQAAAAAVAAGGHLATLSSWDENDAAFQRASPSVWVPNLGPWIGGSQAWGAWEPGGGWGWTTGEAFSFARWAPGEPNNIGCWQGNEDAMHYFSSSGPLWNDHPRGSYCGPTGPIYGAVIEFDADCDASGTVDYADDCLP